MPKKDYAKEYKKWHWGDAHAEEIEWKDNDLPPIVIECGRATEIHFRPLTRSNPKRKDYIMRLPKKEANRSHIVYDPDHPHQRLYILLSKAARKDTKKLYAQAEEVAEIPLSELAEMGEGRHASADYPDVMVKPIGVLTHLVYTTTKIPDGLSHYIHEMGEESGIRPIFAVSKDGRAWVVAGDYHVPVPGITN